MNDKDDLSVWNDFIKKEFRVENKDASLSNAELNAVSYTHLRAHET